MKGLLVVALALVLLSLESVIVRALGFELTRIDVTAVLVVFLAMRAKTVEGALTSFAVGYLLDVFSGPPTWLYPSLAVMVFLLARAAGQLLDGRSRLGFAGFCAAATVGQSLAAFLLTWLTAIDSDGRARSLAVLPVQALLTGVLALVLHALFRRFEPAERTEGGRLV